MKKRAHQKKATKKKDPAPLRNKLAVAVFFLAGILALNALKGSLIARTIGVACIIAALYGFVALYKGKRFIF